MKILLSAWAAARYDPAPSAWVLRKWVRQRQIAPTPELVGKHWYVDTNAKCSAPGQPARAAVAPPAAAPRPLVLQLDQLQRRAACVRHQPPPPGRTALYRHFGEDGALLYVGISLSPIGRLATHASQSHWIKWVARIDVEWHDTRVAAEAAEVKAIRAERPLHNIAHSVGRRQS